MARTKPYASRFLPIHINLAVARRVLANIRNDDQQVVNIERLLLNVTEFQKPLMGGVRCSPIITRSRWQ
jgi:hypothetical protein